MGRAMIGRIDIPRLTCWACSDVKGYHDGTSHQALRSFGVRRDRFNRLGAGAELYRQ
jgi:hypothetical protein